MNIYGNFGSGVPGPAPLAGLGLDINVADILMDIDQRHLKPSPPLQPQQQQQQQQQRRQPQLGQHSARIPSGAQMYYQMLSQDVPEEASLDNDAGAGDVHMDEAAEARQARARRTRAPAAPEQAHAPQQTARAQPLSYPKRDVQDCWWRKARFRKYQ